MQIEPHTEAYNVAGISVSDSFHNCPVDYLAPADQQASRTLKVFVRQCSRLALSKESPQVEPPLLLFLQGGPGFECSSSVPTYSGMLKYLLDRYVVLLLDQRGTGMSTPLNAETLALQGDEDAQFKYLKCFRADSIVRDCEIIRKKITHGRRDKTWVVLGQSFGGFCILSYLSLAPESLKAAIVTGGMAPVRHTHPDAIYSALLQKLLRRNEAYYAKFPVDIGRVQRIVAYLDTNSIASPNGGVLSGRRFRQLGIELGMHNGYDRMHNLVTRAASDLDQFGFLTFRTCEMIEQALNYDGNPIYSILHESIYCQEPTKPSNWASDRILSAHPEFAVARDRDRPVYFYGENIFPWMFEDYKELRGLKSLAHRIAQASWTPLYDLEKLKSNRVPLAASVYIEDMCTFVPHPSQLRTGKSTTDVLDVHVDLAIETLNILGSTKDLITNRYLHNGLRHAPDELLSYLFKLIEELRAESHRIVDSVLM